MPSDGYTHGYASLGAPGPMCRDSADARLLAEALVGRPLEQRRANRLRLGIVPTFWENIDPDVAEHCEAAVERLRESGMSVSEIELEGTDHVRIATVLRLTLEGAPHEKPEISEEIQSEVSPVGRALGKYRMLLPAGALALGRPRARAAAAFAHAAFEEVDVLAWPMTPAPAPPIENTTVELPSGRVPADYANVRPGGIGNLAGVPALSALRLHARSAAGRTAPGRPLARERAPAGRCRAAGAGTDRRFVTPSRRWPRRAPA